MHRGKKAQSLALAHLDTRHCPSHVVNTLVIGEVTSSILFLHASVRRKTQITASLLCIIQYTGGLIAVGPLGTDLSLRFTCSLAGWSRSSCLVYHPYIVSTRLCWLLSTIVVLRTMYAYCTVLLFTCLICQQHLEYTGASS